MSQWQTFGFKNETNQNNPSSSIPQDVNRSIMGLLPRLHRPKGLLLDTISGHRKLT